MEDDAVRAVNDTFYVTINCETKMLIGNVMKNDIHGTKEIEICYIVSPTTGVLYFGGHGLFNFYFPERYSGKVEFSYGISETDHKDSCSMASVTVFVSNDNDCDGVTDETDLDNDNDGILNVDEGDGLLDSDEDGIPDSFDIDSDADGIPDNTEWQYEGSQIEPLQNDINKNGWDDAYDVFLNGTYYEPEDTDKNGIPDFLDLDTDNDGFSDKSEGFDTDGDGFAEIKPLKSDSDKDGLDDAFDIVSDWSLACNSTGSCSPLPDRNKNGIRDWRDTGITAEDDGNAKQEISGKDQLFIYPNPSNGNFNIVTPESLNSDHLEMTIYNMEGHIIYTTNIVSGDNSISSPIRTPGTYIIKVKSESTEYHQFISIQ